MFKTAKTDHLTNHLTDHLTLGSKNTQRDDRSYQIQKFFIKLLIE